jgi:hypothetical protein
MSALAIIQPDTLTLYYSDKSAVGIPVPRTAIADMEVVSEEEIAGLVVKMLGGTPVTGSTPTVLVVSDKFCFSLPLGEKDEEEIEKRLLSLTPFAHVATTHLSAQKQKYLVATNQDLYESVARSLADRGHQVVLVVSWLHLVHAGITQGALDQSVVKKVFESMMVLRPFAFSLTVESASEPSRPSAPTQVKPPAKIPVGWIVFGGVALLYALIMLIFFFRGGS